MIKANTDVERRRALRALLRNPLLSATGETAAEYMLVRRHSASLKQWLAEFPDWSLHVDREVARMRKVPANLLDQTRPAIDRSSGTPFTKRRYAMLCLVLAALEQFDRQTTLGQVAQKIMELVAADRDLQSAGLFFDAGNYDQRRDLVHAVRFLADSGVLKKLGEERKFPNQDDSTDVLYEINRHILSAILQGSHSASAIEATTHRSGENSIAERAAKLNDHQKPATEEGRSQWIRARLVRALLDDPVLYFHDLNDEERNYLEKHRGYLLREICEATGLIAEVRREGIAMVDDTGGLTDVKLPDFGHNGSSQGPIQAMEAHLSLLLVQWFAERSRFDGGAAIPIEAVEERVRDLVLVHGSEWNTDGREAGAETRLMEDALLRLRALRLIQFTAGGVVPLAASGRYAAAE